MKNKIQGSIFNFIEKLLLSFFSLYYLLFFTSSICFFQVGRFIFSPPVIILLIIDTLIIILVFLAQMKIRTKVATAAYVFLLWALFTTGFRHGLSTYLVPMVGLITMWLPMIVKLPISEANRQLKFSKWYCRGLALSFVFAYQDLISSLFSLPRTEELIPFIAESAQRTGNLFGLAATNINLERINSLMDEPSWYAVYLPLGYICIDSLEKQGLISKRKAIFFKVHIIGFLLLTFSLSGLAIFVGYLIISQGLFWAKKGFRLPLKTMTRGLAIATVTIVLLSQVPAFSTAVESVFNRVSAFSERVGSLQDRNLNTSEGSRIHSLAIAIESVNSSNGFMGEGFGATDDWVKKNYSHLSRIYETGHTFNNYGSVLIAVGPLGLFFYLWFIYISVKLKPGTPRNISSTYFYVWLIVGFAMGSLLYYHFWGSFYLVSTRGFNKKRCYSIFDG